MTFDLTEKNTEELLQRQQELSKEIPEETRDAMSTEEIENQIAELEAIKAELEQRQKKAAEEAEARKAVEEGAGEVKEVIKEEKSMTVEEIRSSAEYVDAYVSYIKTGDDKECRALLTLNAAAGGNVPVPVVVDDIVRHAWENENILARVRKTNFVGNVKVAFERSADPAYVHAEGATAHTEEALTLGVVEIKPENIKKYITISDEMMENTGEGFLRYVYEELAYQVMKKLSAEIVNDIKNAETSHSGSAVGIPKVNKDPGLVTIATAAANLCDEATDLCIIMNRLTDVEFQTAYASGNFAVDPYAGLPRVYTSALPAFSTASANDTYAIVGDLKGEQVNFPAGEGLKVIKDEYSLAERDLVKLVGRIFAGHEVVAPGRFVRLTKEAAATT